jgi:hypothetical protein
MTGLEDSESKRVLMGVSSLGRAADPAPFLNLLLARPPCCWLEERSDEAR